MHELGGGEIGLLHRLHKNLVLLLDAILLADVLVVLDVRRLQVAGELEGPFISSRFITSHRETADRPARGCPGSPCSTRR